MTNLSLFVYVDAKTFTSHRFSDKFVFNGGRCQSGRHDVISQNAFQ